MIAIGNKKLTAYYENYKPAERSMDNVKYAGWLPDRKTGEIANFIKTYNDKLTGLVYGKTEQKADYLNKTGLTEQPFDIPLLSVPSISDTYVDATKVYTKNVAQYTVQASDVISVNLSYPDITRAQCKVPVDCILFTADIDNSIYIADKSEVTASAGNYIAANIGKYVTNATYIYFILEPNLTLEQAQESLAGTVITYRLKYPNAGTKTLQASDILGLYTLYTSYDIVSTKALGVYDVALVTTEGLTHSTLGNFKYAASDLDDAVRLGTWRITQTSGFALRIPKGTYADLAAVQSALAGTTIIYQALDYILPCPQHPLELVQNLAAGTYKVTISDGIYEVTIPNDLGGMGTYLDRIVFDTISKKGWVENKIGEKILTGTENWYAYSNFPVTGLSRFFTIPTPAKSKSSEVMCGHFPYIYAAYQQNAECISGAPGDAAVYLTINTARLATNDAAGLKAWLTTTPITAQYILATPTRTMLTFTKVASSTAPELPVWAYAGGKNIEPNKSIPLANTNKQYRLYRLLDKVGSSVTISFDIKSTSTNYTLTANDMRIGGGSDGITTTLAAIGLGVSINSSTFTRVSGTAAIPADGYFSIWDRNYNGQAFIIDNIQTEINTVATAYEAYQTVVLSPDYPRFLYDTGGNLTSKSPQLIPNSIFANGTTGWTGNGFSNLSIVNGMCRATPISQCWIGNANVIIVSGHKYYFAIDILCSAENVGNFSFAASDTWNTMKDAFASIPVTTTLSRKTQIFTATMNSDRLRVSKYASSTGYLDIDNVVLIDLTEIFGAGNEPTKDWCDANLKWTDAGSSTVVIPTNRGIQVAAASTDFTYIDASGNKWIADSLEYVGSGVWNKMQRINNITIDGTVIKCYNVTTNYTDYSRFWFTGYGRTYLSAYHNPLCSHFPSGTTKNTINNGANTEFSILIAWDVLGILSTDDAATKISKANTWFAAQVTAGTPVTVEYIIPTPITTQVTLGELATYPQFTAVNQSGYSVAAYLDMTAKIVDETI